MASNLAPGIEIIERSFSQRIEPTGDTVLGTLGVFAKGPVNERRRISSVDELIKVFGKPSDFSAPYFLSVAKILDQAPVELVRVEESTVDCAGLTVGLSGADVSINGTAIAVASYPLTYDSVFATEVDLTGLTNTVTFAAVGPGEEYNKVSVAMLNKDDYWAVSDFQGALAEATTPSEVRSIAETAYTLAMSGSGIPLSIASELIDVDNSYQVDTQRLDEYVAFQNGPTLDTQFAVYEYYAGVFQNAYLVSVDPESKDRYGKSAFANKVIGELSENIVVFVGGSRAAANSVAPQSCPRTNLAGATALTATAADLEDELYNQLNLNFFSKEDVQIAALVDLDFPLSIKQRMDEICNVRKDCVALLNVPSDRMIDVTTGQKTNNQTGLVKAWADSTMNIDSSYSALYANYFKVYDAYNDTERWIPCTGYVAERLAYTFNNFEPWNAIAGLERGVVSGVLKVAYNPNPDQQKVLYPARINPIVAFRGEGIVIWGQKTLESEPVATDRLNVRELLIYIARELEAYSRTTLFKQNDAFTRASWRANVGPFLNSILQRRGIEDYRVVCDESNNSQMVVARNEFQAFVIVRPTTVAEFVKITIADVGGSLSIDEAILGASV